MKRIILLVILMLSVVIGAAFAEAKPVFNHAKHNENTQGTPCADCHKADAATITPSLDVCATCHDKDFAKSVKFPGLKTHNSPRWAIKHTVEAKSKSANCGACHEQSFCSDCHKSGFAGEQGKLGGRAVDVHRTEFNVTHPLAAKADQQLCKSCHTTKYCSDCHTKFQPEELQVLSHRKGWSNIESSPGVKHSVVSTLQCQTCHVNSVLPAHEWSGTHAKEARRSLATCQTCHADGQTCMKCHSATSGLRINPHPEDWSKMKSNLQKASGGKTCRKCH